jgi:predicted CXXCH cytochrome family protein
MKYLISCFSIILIAVCIFTVMPGCNRDDDILSPAEQSAIPEGNVPVAIHDYGDNCLLCHPEQAPMKLDSDPSLAPYHPLYKLDINHADLLCTTCHNPHGGTSNLRILREEIATPNSGLKSVVLSSYYGSGSLADGDANYNGICEICHTATAYHRNDVSGDHTHYPGARCAGCHNHWSQFAPVTANCLTCHNVTQPNGTGDYRRQVVGSGGDFERNSHHVNDGLGGESITAPDCLVCHQNSRHRLLSDPQVRLYNRDDSRTITYTGTASTMEPFCLSCHDGDTDVPFSDGNSAPDMESAWLASSHHLAGMTCSGDGLSTGCHDNGHGSDKASLKAPFTGATPDEEAFCYGCHDSDGPGIDIEAKFAGTSTGTPGSGSVLNMHHDISDADQTYSGAVLECSNCHDPHSATPAQPHLNDVDTGDGRVPAPGNTFTGSKLSTEFCLECHDNSYPATVTPPTTALTDIYYLWSETRSGDQHGPVDASSNPNLRAGSGYVRGEILDCDACHEMGHGNSTNLYQLKTTIYSKDGTTPLISDLGTYDVYVTTDDVGSTDLSINGQNWCSTCHPNPMGGNKNKGCIDCHFHGDRY